ncbi:bifunctional DNA primase/polymerase [Streptomyces sp. NPDC057654]|uniref:bifunctional DNA primase/polymerase n=1 Tax=Streptomyces sp. NPDC057654 TaxID=3346196 RepID=UPI0036BF8C81
MTHPANVPPDRPEPPAVPLDRVELLAAALAAADRGWYVHPLVPGGKRPALHGADHCPLTGVCAGGHRKWEQRATTDPQRIEQAWVHAPYNVGLAPGPSGLVVIDLDMPKDTDPEGTLPGAVAFAALCERAGEAVPDARAVRTPSGGSHLYFTAPAGVRVASSAGRLARKIDVRAWGGNVVAAGSTTASGAYEVVRDGPLPVVPAWLLDLLAPAPLPPQKPVKVTLPHDRHARWLEAAVNGELARVTDALPGERNNALFLASVALGQLAAGGALAEADVTAWLTDAAHRVGQGEGETRRTIASGLRAGSRRPRKVAA